MAESDQGVAEEFNNYFSTVFTQSLPEIEQIFRGPEKQKCVDMVFTEKDVMKKLEKLREDKAAGADDLSPRFLKELLNSISHPLFLLFRMSLDEGVVPEDWSLVWLMLVRYTKAETEQKQ